MKYLQTMVSETDLDTPLCFHPDALGLTVTRQRNAPAEPWTSMPNVGTW
jgi:hypothetical protein